jgi:hypothetical protein
MWNTIVVREGRGRKRREEEVVEVMMLHAQPRLVSPIEARLGGSG